MIRLFFLICVLIISLQIEAQFAPAAGKPGSTAIHYTSNLFTGWATRVQVNRGYRQINDTLSGLVTSGNDSDAQGIPMSNGVVSLGDAGWAEITLPVPLKNGVGYDFAVFENAFCDTFLELAFVEVSNDGINYFRFPSESLSDTQTQVTNSSYLWPENIHNLAGKYRLEFGTPFDLEDLKGITGLNIDSIIYIRIVDVVGSLNPQWGSRDSKGRIINDPWPTPFPTGGFDLDAIGIIHANYNGLLTSYQAESTFFHPNPANEYIYFSEFIPTVSLHDISGKSLVKEGGNKIYIGDLEPGIYIINYKGKSSKFIKE